MFFVNANDRPMDCTLEGSLNQRFFIFDIEREDYFLHWNLSWDVLTTMFYTITVAGKSFRIPSGTYVLCGCEGGSQDWILIDEIIGRPIDLFVLNKHFKSWSLEMPALKEIEDDGTCFIPMGLKAPTPIMDGTGEKVIIVSQCDQYHKLKDRDFDIFFV